MAMHTTPRCARRRVLHCRHLLNAVARRRSIVRVMRTLPFPVVAPVRGVSFHQDVVVRAQIGARVVVQADPTNEYDANACAVLLDGELAGHLPRELAARLRADGRGCWDAEIVEVLRGSLATGLRVRLLGPREEVPGDRDPGTGFAVAAGDEGFATLVEPATVGAVEVRARSGRRLGRYVGHRDGVVLVLTDDAREVRYPETLVELHELIEHS